MYRSVLIAVAASVAASDFSGGATISRAQAPMQGAAVYRGAVTAWFLYQLTGDQKAGAMFKGDKCGYCTAADWTAQRNGKG